MVEPDDGDPKHEHGGLLSLHGRTHRYHWETFASVLLHYCTLVAFFRTIDLAGSDVRFRGITSRGHNPR
jgi:hypothetical protein